MLTPVVVGKRPYLAICLPTINSRLDVKELRDSILDVISSVLSDEGTKESASSTSFFHLLCVVDELNKDLEVMERGGKT